MCQLLSLLLLYSKEVVFAPPRFVFIMQYAALETAFWLTCTPYFLYLLRLVKNVLVCGHVMNIVFFNCL